MSVFTMIFLGLMAVLLGYGIAIYNRLVNLKHNVSKAWSNIVRFEAQEKADVDVAALFKS